MPRIENKAATEKPLPKTRREALLDILHYRFFDVVAVSILWVLFLLPSIAWMLFVSLSDLHSLTDMYSILIVYGVLAVLFSISGLGSVGAFYFFRKLSYAEGCELPSHFFLGIKNNWKMGLLSHFVLGVLYLILKLDIAAIAAIESDALYWSIAGISYGLFFILSSFVLFVLPQTVTYEGGFFRLLFNSMRFFIGKFFHYLGVSLVFFLPFFVCEFVPYIYYQAQWAMVLFEGIFYYGFSTLIVTLLSHYLFDISINPRYYPEQVGKGLDKAIRK